MAFIIAFGVGALLKPTAAVVDRCRIDDTVGAVMVHGIIAIYDMLLLGITAKGYPALGGVEGVATVSFMGQPVRSAVFTAIRFLVDCVDMIIEGSII